MGYVRNLEHYAVNDLWNLYAVKYPFNNKEEARKGMTNFEIEDNMPDPIRLKGKYWDFIKEEMRLAIRENL